MTEVTSRVGGSTARVAGAMAHELNNPLQGLLSALAAAVREFSADDRFVTRLRQIEGGVTRVSRAVSSLASLHERMPREPDSIDLASLVEGIRGALADRGLRLQARGTSPERWMVSGFAAELVQLTTEVLNAMCTPDTEIREWIEVCANDTTVRYDWSADQTGLGGRQLAVHEQDGLSGLPVVLDEVVKLAGGHLDLIWIDDHITGIALVLINECER